MMTWSSGGRWNPRLHNNHLADWSGRDALLQVGCHGGLKLTIEFKGNGVKVKSTRGLNIGKTVLSEMILTNWSEVKVNEKCLTGEDRCPPEKNDKKTETKKLRRQVWQKWRQPEVLDSWSQFSKSSIASDFSYFFGQQNLIYCVWKREDYNGNFPKPHKN